MRHIPLVLVLLSSACADGGPEVGALSGPCEGEATLKNDAGEAVGWFDTSVDALLRTVSHVSWKDASRTAYSWRTTSVWDEDRLSLSLQDVDGDGLDDVEGIYEYDGSGRLVLYELRADPEYDRFGTGIQSREISRYDTDGRLVETTRDLRGDDTIDARILYFWLADGRQDRIETLTFGEVAPPTVTTTFTWFDPAPGLDHRIESRHEGDTRVIASVERIHDEAGNLAWEQTEDVWSEEPRVVEWTRDEDGVLTETLTTSGTHTLRQSYVFDPLGLPLLSSRESDDGDGIIDDTQRTSWLWRCTGG